MQSVVKILAVCAAGATGLSADHASSHAHKLSSSLRVAALGKAEEKFLQRKRPAHPHSEESEPPEEVQHEVETMMKRVQSMGDSHLVAEYNNELEGVEAALADRVGAAGSFANKQLVDEVGTMRANLCVEQGFERHETADCENFMRVACSLDGNTSSSQQGSPVSFVTCQKFFQEYRREEGAKHKKEDPPAEEEAAAEEGGEGDDAAEEEKGNETESGGLFGGKKERDLPEQGYNEYYDGHKHKVQHNNLETMTGDWQSEGEGRNMETICKEFPDNEWCQLHTDSAPAPPPPAAPKPPVIKSAAAPASSLPAFTALVTASAVILAW